VRRPVAAFLILSKADDESAVEPAHSKEVTPMSERKSIDCRDYPSESGCTLRLEGTEDEVLEAAVNHAITRHGHTDNPELREQIRRLLKPA
jgi:uncharacterized protein DUF1059